MATYPNNEPVISVYGAPNPAFISEWGNFGSLNRNGVSIVPGILIKFKDIPVISSANSMDWFTNNPLVSEFLQDCGKNSSVSILWNSSPVLAGIPRRYDCAYLDLDDNSIINQPNLQQFIESIKLFTEQLYGNLPQSFIESEIIQLEKQRVPRYWNLDINGLLLLAKRILLNFESEFNRPYPTLIQQIELVIQKLLDEWNNSPAEKELLSLLIKRQYRSANPGLVASGIVFPDRLVELSNDYIDRFALDGDLDDFFSGAISTVPFDEIPNLNDDVKRAFSKVKDWVNDLQSISQASVIIDRCNGLLVDEIKEKELPTDLKLRLVEASIKSGKKDFINSFLSIRPEDLSRILIPRLSIEQSRNLLYVGSGVPASPGICSGFLCTDVRKINSMIAAGAPIVLAANSPGPEIVKSAQRANGLLFATGGATSHIAVIARGENKPCVSGVSALYISAERGLLSIGENSIKEGGWITIDGSSGKVYFGKVEKSTLILPEMKTINSVLDYCDDNANIQVYANADTATEAENAFSYGAKGIGLCRIEHLLARPASLENLQRVMLLSWLLKPYLEKILIATRDAATWSSSKGALTTLKELEQAMSNLDIYKRYKNELNKVEDILIREFSDLINISKGRTVTIRLIDPPLAEFLNKEIIDQLHSDNIINDDQKADLMRFIDRKDSMIGLRGIRLCNIAPEFTNAQIKSILLACKRSKSDVKPNVDILVPFVIDAFEMANIRSLVADCSRELGVNANCRVGAMVETPRSVMVIKEIVKYSDFLSFGTNDLTQFTWAASRDYAEGDFLQHISYTEMGLDPFVILDQKGVGGLLDLAVHGARSVSPAITIGVCGEHASETRNLSFFEGLGINYLSCTIPHIRSVRLACGQRAIQRANLLGHKEEI